jgi:hypothetical protein
VIDNCRSTERHARGSLKERAGRREERASPNDCQEKILSRKNGASHKHHRIKQLQQIITDIRHQGKTKAVNISLFFFLGISKMDFGFFPALQTERQNPRRISSHTLLVETRKRDCQRQDFGHCVEAANSHDRS